MAILSKVKETASALIRGTQRLRDPGNVDSQIQRSDLATPGPGSEPAVGDAKTLIDLGKRRYEESREGRWRHNEQFYTGISFFQGSQDRYWDGAKMAAIRGENPDMSERFIHKYRNMVRVMAERAASRITAQYPDAWAAPLTGSEADKRAAQIHRAVNGHCTRQTHRQQLIREAVLAMIISTTCFIEAGWDPNAEADIGIPMPDGSVQYHKAAVGDVTNGLILAIDAYPDPNSILSPEGIHGGAYFIKRCTRSTSFIERKWGKTVEATTTESTYGYLEQRLEWLAGDYSRSTAKNKTATGVTEVWEKPSPQFPKGRWWAYSDDGTLLYAGWWPYEKKDKYPFIGFGFQKNFGSIWSLNLVGDLIPDQMTLNRLATYLAGRLEWDRPVQYVPDNAAVSPDDLISPHYAQTIPYKGEQVGGAKPVWTYPPPPGNFYFAMEQSLLDSMERIAGVHDFNTETTNPSNSGKEFELRMQEDKSRLGPVVQHVCENVVELYEWDGALYRQFGASFPRLLGLDDKSVPSKDLEGQNAAASALVDLQALKDGNCRVVLQPGSGESKLPAAQEEHLWEMVKAMANLPGPLVEFALNQSQAIRSDAEVDRLIQGLKEYEAEKAQREVSVQQMKGDQAQQELDLKAKTAEAQANAQAQTEQAKAAISVHAQSLQEQFRLEANSAAEHQRFVNSMRLLQAKAKADSLKISLTGKLGPNAIASAEEAAGLQPDVPADILAMNKPATKAPPSPTNKPKEG